MIKQTKTIGSILLDVELVTQEDINRALELQKQTGKRLGEVLINLGVVSDDDIRWALAEQLNLPYVNIRKDQIDVEVATLLPEKLARRYHVIPILKIENELTVVVDDPLNTTVIKDIETITKSDVKISLGRTSDILLAIDEIYGSEGEQLPDEQESPPQFISPWFTEEDIQKILNDPSGHVLMERILTVAFEHGVSRIYFQPGFDICHVSYRVDGVLQEHMRLSKEWYSILFFRLKITANLEITETRRPQYREFSYTEYLTGMESSNPPVMLAVSILPTAAGESAVLNVINKSVEQIWTQENEVVIPPLQKQELLEVQNFRETLPKLKFGAVLLGGTPYVDKMTTLYGLLKEFDPVRKKIVTLESYPEYRADKYYQIRYSAGVQDIDVDYAISVEQEPALQHGLSHDELSQEDHTDQQSQAEPKILSHQIPSSYHAQLTSKILNPAQKRLSIWLAVLEAHDADVLLVDHIASDVVVAQCVDFAAKGILLAALDFRDVFQILGYLLDCQVKPSELTSLIHALMAQQSIRILCQECKQKDTTDFGKHMLTQLYPEVDTSQEVYAPGGCSACNMTGYAHQVVLFEILQMEPWLKQLLGSDTSLADIQRVAQDNNFESLKKKSLDLLFSGQTSLEEVVSVLT